ncbi:MAG: hypothetical protein ABEJ82_01845 [Haloplanus sp.]
MQEPSLASICAHVLVLVARRCAALVRVAAFWAAIVLPMLYVPLLLLGTVSATAPSILWKLVALNIAALVVGYGYGTPLGEDREGPARE